MPLTQDDLTILYTYGDVDKRGYIDFSIPDISGVFRATNSYSGVSVNNVLEHVESNLECIKSRIEVDHDFWGDVSSWINWGGGWEWKEKSHKTQRDGYGVGTATLHFTLPFASRAGAMSMDNLYPQCESCGIDLMKLHNDSQPSSICYFFPFKTGETLPVQVATPEDWVWEKDDRGFGSRVYKPRPIAMLSEPS